MSKAPVLPLVGPGLPPVDLYLPGAVPAQHVASSASPPQTASAPDDQLATSEPAVAEPAAARPAALRPAGERPQASWRRKTSRRRRAVILGCAAAGVAAAGVATAAAGIGLAVSSPPPTPLSAQQLAGAVTQTTKSGSVSWVLEVKGRFSFGGVETGVEDLPNGPWTMTLGRGLDESSIRGALYVELAAGRWTAVSPKALALQFPTPLGGGIGPTSEGPGTLLPYLSMLEARTTTARHFARQNVEGRLTTEYSFRAEPALASSGGIDIPAALIVGPAAVDIWINGAGLVQQYTITPLRPTSSEPVLIRWTAVHFGPLVAIRPPPANEVRWAPAVQ